MSTRTLNAKLQQSIVDFIKENSNKKIRVSSIFGNVESKKFAEKIVNFIEKNNYKIFAYEEVIYEEPIQGVVFTNDKNFIEILVCEK